MNEWMNEWMNKLLNTVFVEQLLILPGTATNQARIFTQLVPSIWKVLVHSRNNFLPKVNMVYRKRPNCVFFTFQCILITLHSLSCIFTHSTLYNINHKIQLMCWYQYIGCDSLGAFLLYCEGVTLYARTITITLLFARRVVYRKLFKEAGGES